MFPTEWKPKPWGRTRTLFCDAAIEIVECEIKAGGYSSFHAHSRKHNEFRVMGGRLIVRRRTDEVQSGWTVGPNDKCLFPAGSQHQFEALADTRLIEIYTSADGSPVDPDDIERFTSGGLRQ